MLEHKLMWHLQLELQMHTIDKRQQHWQSDLQATPNVINQTLSLSLCISLPSLLAGDTERGKSRFCWGCDRRDREPVRTAAQASWIALSVASTNLRFFLTASAYKKQHNSNYTIIPGLFISLQFHYVGITTTITRGTAIAVCHARWLLAAPLWIINWERS